MSMKEEDNRSQQESPIQEPYSYLTGSGFSGKPQKYSPDPLVAYQWAKSAPEDELELFLQSPVLIQTSPSNHFKQIETESEPVGQILVTGPGRILLDFGTEFAGWLEIDSPNLSGDITLGISEYHQPAFVNQGPRSPSKTAVPIKYGNTYRLELNEELYEGVRFGFIQIRHFHQPFQITAIRLVCQAKPVNYKGSFHCDNEMLNRIWYTAAYTVRVNLKQEYLAAILMDRGDRHSWTGDAYPSQAAALAVFGNYAFILQNLRYTAIRPNGIESYELYWVLSVIEYYRYTGDDSGVESLLQEVTLRLDHAWEIYGANPSLGFFGWDERLGAGFENPDLPENQNSYKLLAIQCWAESSEVLLELGYTQLAEKYSRYAQRRKRELQRNPAFYKSYGMHASADAINAGVLDCETLYHKDFSDRLNRLSYSPFNQYFILQAMGKAGKYDDAIASVLDLWGGQIQYGGTTFFETYRPCWNDVIERNAPVPNNQAGYTSLGHPWSAGVLPWMSRELLGIQPIKAGFRKFSVTPHLGRYLTRVSGEMPTVYGTIAAHFDIQTGLHRIQIPQGTTARVGIPKAEKTIVQLWWNGEEIKNSKEDRHFVYLEELEAGEHRFAVMYAGKTPSCPMEEYRYPAVFLGKDETTKGNWMDYYGADGYIICGRNAADDMVLPDYIAEIRFQKCRKVMWEDQTQDERGLVVSGDACHKIRIAAAWHSQDDIACCQTFTVDIELKRTQLFTMALYFTDWDEKNRELAVELFDGNTLNLIAPVQTLSGYAGGIYFLYQYHNSVRFRINQIRGINATLSGIFFESVEK